MSRRVLAIGLLLVITIIPVYWKAYASLDAISLQDYHSPTFNSHLGEIPNRELLDKLVYVPSGVFAEKEAASMVSRLSHIPRSILSILVQQNIHLYLFNGSLTEVQGYEHLHGIKPRGYSLKGSTWEEVPGIGGSKLVLAKIGHSNKGMGHGSVNLELHELAHSIDRYVLGNVRMNQAFLTLWQEEAPLLFPGKEYFLIFPEEYFAETFAMFYLNESSKLEIAMKAPKTYLFLENLEASPTSSVNLLGVR